MASKNQTSASYHEMLDAWKEAAISQTVLAAEQTYTYRFENFYHPFVGELIERLNKHALDGLFDPVFQQKLETDGVPADISEPNSFFKIFDGWFDKPGDLGKARVEGRPRNIDLSPGGPYSNYNWEILYHLPVAVATHLSNNGRFAEAQQIYHLVFEPLSTDLNTPRPQRYWRFPAFRNASAHTPIDQALKLLSADPATLTPEQQEERAATIDAYENIKNSPYNPYVVARARIRPFQYFVFMKYLDNLISWGDSLFRQDTVESNNEASQLYVLAANLLGRRPERIPETGRAAKKTYAQLKAHGLDAMGNALVELESQFPLNLVHPQSGESEQAEALFGIGRTLYFCIPHNEKLLSYWDIVADRLYKLRHCMNIEGVVRQLPLFDPPIDPAMLVKAAAAGLDVNALLGGLNKPTGPIRVAHDIQKAIELAREMQSYGNTLLAAIEKGDAEHLALVRQGMDTAIHAMTEELHFLRYKQATEATEALVQSRASALEKYRYYQRVLAQESDDTVAAATLEVERPVLTSENFDEIYAGLVDTYKQVAKTKDYPQLTLKEEGELKLLPGEYDEINGHADRALASNIASAATDAVTAGLALIPNLSLKAAYWGIGTDTERIAGGTPLSAASNAVSAGLKIWALVEEYEGNISSKTASYLRRADEWLLQSKLAAIELASIGRQLVGSLIAEQVARQEYLIVQKQLAQSKALSDELESKFSSEELYLWMQGETTKRFYEYYRLVFDFARAAERKLKREVRRPELEQSEFVKFNYWDSGRKGLLSGDALLLDLRRMELAYQEHHKRELELTAHLSLRRIDPVALLALKAFGQCEVTIPEWIYDLETPGLFMRRIKSVGLSIPSITGPYTSVNCKLTLVKSTLRTSAALKEGEYARQGPEDERFADDYGVQSIMTSNAAQDSGLFEINFSDPRYLPFEGTGVIGTWRIELPAEFRQFDYRTISDVVIHMRYTARDGGAIVRGATVDYLKERLSLPDGHGLQLLLSLDNDFPEGWAAFSNGLGEMTFTITRDFFPYFTQGKSLLIRELAAYAIVDGELVSETLTEIDLQAVEESLEDDGRATITVPRSEIVDDAHDVFVVLAYSLDTE